MVKHKNGSSGDMDFAERSMMRGRPIRKSNDPVRQGIRQLMRSINEVTNMWKIAVQYDEKRGVWVTADFGLAEHARRAVDFWDSRITTLTRDMEKRLQENPSTKATRGTKATKKASPRRAVKRIAARKAKNSKAATETAQA